MSYLVFARKFRPQTFDEVIGQEPITTTLKNAISKNRIAQSFLFTGSRGVGKTSTARIFAKALNCEKGPAPDPCNKCSICQEITQCTSLDILEIDGASNRGVDEIRNLRDNIKFKPARARFKIYIIDEVHMLTGEAFNALLKTLEEPPEHVKFIFATTEVHKLPLTILSRCQRFNFRRIPTEDLIAKLEEIAKKEKIKINDKALFLIAKSSEGSLRDAESLLDQMASFGEGEIKETDVTFSLGLTDEDLFFSIIESLKNKDSKSVLSAVQTISEEGKDLTQFVKGLLELFRDLLVLKVGEQTENLVEVTEEALKSLKKLKDSFTQDELLFALTLIQQLMREIRWSETPRFLIETCLLKIVHRADLRSIDELLSELKAAGKNSGSFPAFSPAQPTVAASESFSKTSNIDSSKKKQNLSSEISSAQRGESAENVGGASVAALPRNDISNMARQNTAVITSLEGAKQSGGSGQAAQFHAVIPAKAGIHKSGFLPESTNRGSSPPIETFGGDAKRRFGNDQKSAGAFSFDDVCRVWPELVDRVKSAKMSCGTFLSEALPVDVVDGFAVFGFPVHLKFHKEALEQQAHKELIRLSLSALIGTEANVSFIIKDNVESPQNPIPPKLSLPVSPIQNEPLKDNDIVNSALHLFGGSKIIHRD